jgi:hypothetical protein
MNNDEILNMMVCPSCCAVEYKDAATAQPWACQTCGYNVDFMPSIVELISGAVETEADWSDVDLGAWLRRCLAAVMTYSDTINPAAARTLGFILAARHPKLGPALIAEIGKLSRDRADL